MKIAILGGTHGNEPVGIKVIEALSKKVDKYTNDYKTFLANPKAHRLGIRYVDFDLNRSFGKDDKSIGNEKSQAEILSKEITGNYDFVLDLHTTTSNMGLTVILTHLDERSVKAACYLKKINPELKIIISVRAGKECPYTTHMVHSGLTVEVGPVANNVINSHLIIETHKMVKQLLDFDFMEDFKYSQIECFKTKGLMTYPLDKDWMLHPNVDGHDFQQLKSGDPLFITIDGDELKYDGETIYPLFVNEAAYQENNTALEFAVKTTLDQVVL